MQRSQPTTALVLIVEDNRINRIVAQRFLEGLGCDVSFVTDGQQAVDRVSSETFDLILMDCQMPNMDGYEATRQIRALGNASSKTPIVAMTAHAMKGERERCQEAGMNDHIAKPVNEQMIHGVLQRWVAQAHGRTKPVGKKRSQSPSRQLNSPIDPERWSALGEVIGQHGRISLEEIIRIYREDSRTRLEELRKAYEQSNTDEIEIYAHAIKGSAANIGANMLSALAGKMEGFAERGELENARSLLPLLEMESSRVEDFLVNYSSTELKKG